MSYLRTTRRRTFDERRTAFLNAVSVFHTPTPKLCDDSRTKVAVQHGRKGRMKSVSIHYRHGPKELGIEFLNSPLAKVV